MVGLLWEIFNILKETVNRIIKFPELLLTLLGWRFTKRLKLRIVVLRDERGLPLIGNEEVTPAFDEARRILSRMAGVVVEPAGWRVVTAPHAAPKAALDVHCTDGAWRDDLGQAGDFYRSLMATTTAGTLLGYGAPLTVFIVRSISSHNGCSLGAATDYVTVEARTLKNTRRLLVHEVAHACGLWHSQRPNNLMIPKGPGEELTGWQAAVLRTSRHVTYF
ncbi:MAG: hypothetical protein KIS95_03430 [Anaerolineae bacterium]|uniref:hypothetical protein n=1 Tax=Promineifilum sp. TaxID=2664178 RepID=UPI001D4CB414|nr:hypothetical protein [Anaerolineales bacterium]MCB8935195.1 hypothetical protein [Promineifilum sp.]MCO5179020.1 hypothetical protein [Promineifilum sp.]MCW5846257.1 hypothetical protein [Anaerolineae bacterium]